jgi:hypothetical protein
VADDAERLDELGERDQEAEGTDAHRQPQAPAPTVGVDGDEQERQDAQEGGDRLAAEKGQAAAEPAERQPAAAAAPGSQHRQGPPRRHRQDVVEGKRAHHPTAAGVGQRGGQRGKPAHAELAGEGVEGQQRQQPVQRVVQVEGRPEGERQVEEVAGVEGESVGVAAERLAEPPRRVEGRHAAGGQLARPEGLEVEVRGEDVAQEESPLSEGERQRGE